MNYSTVQLVKQIIHNQLSYWTEEELHTMSHDEYFSMLRTWSKDRLLSYSGLNTSSKRKEEQRLG
jgi:hypothetical protein